jgi:hypothetical protein
MLSPPKPCPDKMPLSLTEEELEGLLRHVSAYQQSLRSRPNPLNEAHQVIGPSGQGACATDPALEADSVAGDRCLPGQNSHFTAN